MTTERHAPASPEFYLDQALVAFERARELIDEDDDPGTYGVVLHDIAQVYETTGRAGEALDLYRRSAAAKRLGSAPDDLEITLSTLAASLIDHAEFTEARAVLDEAAELLSRAGMDISPPRRARRAFDLGLLYERLGDYGEVGVHVRALETFEWALSLLDEHTDPGSCAAALRAVARMQLVVGREHDAATSLAEAVRLLERDGDRVAQASVYIDLGRVYGRLADLSVVAPEVPAPRAPGEDRPEPGVEPRHAADESDGKGDRGDADDASRARSGSDGFVAAGAVGA